jgi:hypothetical protein
MGRGLYGEKFCQDLKPRLGGGLPDNWHVNGLKGVLKVDTLQRIELPLMKINIYFQGKKIMYGCHLITLFCLLNIQFMMEEFGLIPNLWEGGYNGDKFCQDLKPRLRGGSTENWHENGLKGVLKDDTLQRIERPIKKDIKQHNERDRRCVKYSTMSQVMLAYNERKPISVVMHQNGKLGAIINTIDNFPEINLTKQNKCNGIFYWKVTLNSIAGAVTQTNFIGQI